MSKYVKDRRLGSVRQCRQPVVVGDRQEGGAQAGPLRLTEDRQKAILCRVPEIAPHQSVAVAARDRGHRLQG